MNAVISILFDGVTVGEQARLKDCIVDKDVHIPAGETVGYHRFEDAERFAVSENAVVVIPKEYQFKPRLRLPSAGLQVGHSHGRRVRSEVTKAV